MAGGAAESDESMAMTSMHIARAHDGDDTSSAWLVARFSPFLELQAGYRLGENLRRLIGPGDLVNEVWLATLPRLGDLIPRDGRWTPVLLKFLATVLLNKVNKMLTRQARERSRRRDLTGEGTGVEPLDRFPSPVTSVAREAERDEVGLLVRGALQELDPQEQEILVLFGIEQLPNQDIARRLGVKPSTASMRYRRALDKLKRVLPRSLLDELPAG